MDSYQGHKAKVVMYKKDPCPYCDRAENFFKAHDVVYEKIDLTGKPEEIQKMKDHWGWATVPIIVVDGTLVGGYSDLKSVHDSGGLADLLKV